MFWIVALGSLLNAQIVPTGVLSGATQGQPPVGTSSGGLQSSSAWLDASAFNGTDPCNQINLAIQASSSLGVEIEAGGVSAAAHCTFLTANFLGNMPGGSQVLAKGGRVKLGGYTLLVPFVPSDYGCLTTVGHCANGPNPPRGIIVIPNKHLGIEGIGRGDTTTPINSTIAICLSVQGCSSTTPNAPVIRNWTISSTGCCSPFALPTGHRNYLTVNVTAQTFTATVSNSVGVNNIVTVTVNSNSQNNVSGILSSGQSVTLSGFAPAGYNGPATVADGSVAGSSPPTTNSSGQTVFTFVAGSALTCTTCTSTNGLAIGSNVLAGEHVKIVGSSQATNNINGRVCSTSTAGGIQQDPHCPVTPSATSFAIVATSNDQKSNNLGAQAPVACSSSCGTVYAEIPIVDYGSDPTGNQFGMMLRHLGLACEGIPSCVGFRSQSANEESGAEFVLVTGSSMWCGDLWSTNAQNSNSWHDLECITGPALNGSLGTSQLSNCDVATTGFIVGESGARSFYGNTVNLNGCATGGASPVVVTPTACYYFDNSTLTKFTDVHGEGCQFNRLYGQGAPSQAYQGLNNGGQASGSCSYTLSGTAVNGCNSVDGPYTFPTTLSAGTISPTTTLPVHSTTGCVYNATLGTGMLVTVGTLGGVPPQETVQLTAAPSGGNLTVTATGHNHSNNDPVFCGWSAVEAVNGNFPLAVAGVQSGPWTGDYSFQNTKKNTGAVITIADDYSNAISNDNVIELYSVDSNTSGGSIIRRSSSGIVADLVEGCFLGGATGTASPAACGTAVTGKIAVPASQTTYTVNDAAVTSTSTIVVQQTNDNSGLPSSPTCNAGATGPIQTSRVAGSSFTFSLTSVASVTCIQYTITNGN